MRKNMKKYFLTRLALALPVILLVSVFSFALVFLAPGDPAAQYRTLEMTDEEYEQLKTELGYNDPVIVQYGRWLGNVLHGDFGVSTSSHTGSVAPHQGQTPGHRGANGQPPSSFPCWYPSHWGAGRLL